MQIRPSSDATATALAKESLGTSELEDFDDEADDFGTDAIPITLPRGERYSYQAPVTVEASSSNGAILTKAAVFSGQIAVTSFVNSLADSCKLYWIAYGGVTPVAAVSVMTVIEWFPTIVGACLQGVAKNVTEISHLDEDRPLEAPPTIMLGPSASLPVTSPLTFQPGLYNVGRIWRDGLKLAFIASVPLKITFYFSGTIFTWMGYTTDVAELGQQYLRGNLIGIFPYLASINNAQLANTIGKSHVVCFVQVISGVLGNGMSYLFGVRAFGPNMFGVGIGMGLAPWASFLIMLSYYYRASLNNSLMRSYGLFNTRTSTRSYIGRILQAGWGVSFFYGFELSTLFVATRWIGARMGTQALAIQSIVQTVGFLEIVPPYGANESAMIMVSRNKTEGRFKDMIRSGHANAFIGGVYGALCFTACEIWPENLIRFITGSTDAAFIAEAAWVMRWAAPAFLLDPIRIIYSGADRGLSRNLMTVLSSFIGLGVIGLGSSYFLSFALALGLIGLVSGRNIGLFVSMLWMYLSFVYGAAKTSGTTNAVTIAIDGCCTQRERPLYPSSRQRFFANNDDNNETHILISPTVSRENNDFEGDEEFGVELDELPSVVSTDFNDDSDEEPVDQKVNGQEREDEQENSDDLDNDDNLDNPDDADDPDNTDNAGACTIL